MKRRLWILALLLVAAGAVGAVLASTHGAPHSATKSASPSRPKPSTKLLGVDELMRHVGRYRKGDVRVCGVVSGVSPGKRSVALIDRREFDQCGLGCAELTLPVHWAGAMPALRELVRVTGKIEEKGGRLRLVARSVSKLHGEAHR